MFKPKYNLNSNLLDNIVKIKNLILDLNNQTFSNLILAKFEKDSYAISAFASTSIEGNPIPLTDVKKLLKSSPEHVRDTEKEVLNYNRALEFLNTQLSDNKTDNKNINIDFICKIQSIVVKDLMGKHNVGKFRQDAVVVNDPKKRQIAYIPPNFQDVKELMSQLVNFLKQESDNVDPLILAGIFHKQFVIIHPFMDGNGRTTRLITKYLLARMGLNTFKLFSFENYYNQNVTKYFSKVGVLGDYYEISPDTDFTDWLIYFTDGIIDELLRVQKMLYASIVIQKPTEYEKNIVQYIKKYGSISISEYKTITDRARSTQIWDFKRLVDKGVLQKNNLGKATFYTLSGL